MGLSNEERRTKMYYAVRGICGVVERWEERTRNDTYDFEKFKVVRDLTGQLWHGLFGKQSNGLHWIMGSSASNPMTTTDPSTPWEMGLCHHLEGVFNEPGPFDFEGRRPFDAVEHCNIEHLLMHAGEHSLAGVYEIYAWCEQLIYALRRYNDEFLTQYSVVDKIVSNIMGECFTAFTQRGAFSQAYVLNQIIGILYGGGSYPYQEDKYDFVIRILSEHNIHHDMARWMRKPMQDVCEIHKVLALRVAYAQDLADRQGEAHLWGQDRELRLARLDATLQMGKSFYEYDHVRKKVLKTVEQAGGKRLRLRAERAMRRYAEMWKEDKTKEKERTRRDLCERNPLGVYGYDAWRETEKFFNKNAVQK